MHKYPKLMSSKLLQSFCPCAVKPFPLTAQ